MFIHSDLHLADTNQPVAYSGPGETKDVDRIANCNWSPRQEKQLSFDVCPQVAWWCKMTHQPGGGGFGRTPRTPPGCAPVHPSKRLCSYLPNCVRNEVAMRESFLLPLQGMGGGGGGVSMFIPYSQ